MSQSSGPPTVRLLNDGGNTLNPAVVTPSEQSLTGGKERGSKSRNNYDIIGKGGH